LPGISRISREAEESFGDVVDFGHFQSCIGRQKERLQPGHPYNPSLMPEELADRIPVER
jgi:hypothetical protein